jgi:hypothetical protein
MIRPRLTKEQRREVVEMYTKGTPILHISQQFKVTRPTIYNIIESQGNLGHKKIDFYSGKSNENKEEMEPIENIVTSDDEVKASSSTTSFLGVVIDTENGTSNPKIRKALDKSFSLLDIMKFIEVTKFKLNMIMFDYFWQIVVGNHNTLVGRIILEWFGYDGEYYKQRQNFKKMLKNNDISFNELTHKDTKHELYPMIQTECKDMANCDIAKSKFLVMEPNDLKMAIMQLKTKNGHIIRQYYIDLEELLKLYVEYTLYFNHRESQRKITNLEKMMAKMDLEREQDREYMRSLGISLEEVKDQNETLIDQNEELLDNNKGLKKDVKDVKRKLGIAVKDRAPLPVDHGPKDHDRDPALPDRDEDKQERFVLLKRNDDEHYQYYTIRAQHGYTERRIKTQKVLFPHLVVLLDFTAHPNSKTLYNRIKDELRAKNVIFSGNNIDLEGSEVTQEELIEEMKAINDHKLCIE